jgi:hypothetical protein
MEITYENLKSLIVEEIWTDNQVKIKFQAKNQEHALESYGMAMPDQEEMMKKMQKEIAKMTGANMAVSTGANVLGNLTGIPGAGSLIGSAASEMGVGYQMDMQKMMQVDLTDEVKQKTVVNAFAALQTYYKFEGGEWSYVVA